MCFWCTFHKKSNCTFSAMFFMTKGFRHILYFSYCSILFIYRYIIFKFCLFRILFEFSFIIIFYFIYTTDRQINAVFQFKLSHCGDSVPTQICNIVSAWQSVPESTVRILFQIFSLDNLKSSLRVAVESKIESGLYNIVKTYGTNQKREESVEIPHDFTDSNWHGFIFATICLFVILDRLFISHVKRKRDFL